MMTMIPPLTKKTKKCEKVEQDESNLLLLLENLLIANDERDKLLHISTSSYTRDTADGPARVSAHIVEAKGTGLALERASSPLNRWDLVRRKREMMRAGGRTGGRLR